MKTQIKFPIEIENGKLALVSGVELAKQRIRERLHEQTGRRIYTEGMGADLHKAMGQKNTAVRKNLISALIRKALKNMEGLTVNGIDFLNVTSGDSVEIRLRAVYDGESFEMEETL